MADLAATAHATLAQDAGVVIDGDRGGGFVVTAWGGQPGIAGSGKTRLACQVLQLAVVSKLLPLAGSWMVRHQQLQEGAPNASHIFRRCLHHHSRFDLSNARGGVDTLSNIHHAHPANPHRGFILLMTQDWNGNPRDPRGIEDSGSGRNHDLALVNGEPYIRKLPYRSGSGHYITARG